VLNIGFRKPAGAGLRLLCLGAHADDIEIGCGGTILRLLEEHDDLEVRWVVLSAAGPRATEASNSAERFLARAKRKSIVIRDFEDGFFPYNGAGLKIFFEELKSAYAPDLIFTHCRNDLHQDHKTVCDLTWNTFRDHMILEYEIVKYDGDIGAPNFFVPLTPSVCNKKVSILLECFTSQSRKKWFTEDMFLSIMRLRGIECNAPQNYAEACYCRKLVC
jgi:LmbE family N-acetylglucosaminyl deacetylase